MPLGLGFMLTFGLLPSRKEDTNHVKKMETPGRGKKGPEIVGERLSLRARMLQGEGRRSILAFTHALHTFYLEGCGREGPRDGIGGAIWPIVGCKAADSFCFSSSFSFSFPFSTGAGIEESGRSSSSPSFSYSFPASCVRCSSPTSSSSSSRREGRRQCEKDEKDESIITSSPVADVITLSILGDSGSS